MFILNRSSPGQTIAGDWDVIFDPRSLDKQQETAWRRLPREIFRACNKPNKEYWCSELVILASQVLGETDEG